MSLLCWMALAYGETVAVLPLEQAAKSEAHEGLGQALSGMLVTDLSQIEGLELVERDQLTTVLSEIELGKTGYLDPKTAQTAGKGVGAEWVLVGSYSVVGETFLMDARAVAVKSGKILAAADANGTLEDFISVEKDLVEGLSDKLKLELSSSSRRKILAAAPTESFEAFSTYAAAMSAEEQADYDKAKQLYDKAGQLDPEFAAAREARLGLAARVKASSEDHRDKQRSAREQRLDRIAAAGPSDPKQWPKKPDFEAWSTQSLRWVAMVRLGRHCEVADEMTQWIDRYGVDTQAPEHPASFNAHHHNAHRMGVYDVAPKPWDHGTVMPPREGARDVADDALQLAYGGIRLLHTADTWDTPARDEGLLGQTVACHADDPENTGLAIAKLREQIDAWDLSETPDRLEASLDVRDIVDRQEAYYRVSHEGMSPRVTTLVEGLMDRAKGTEAEFKITSFTAQITGLASAYEHTQRITNGHTAADYEALLDGIVNKGPGFRWDDDWCSSAVGNPLQSYPELLKDLQDGGRNALSGAAYATEIYFLIGCSPAEEGLGSNWPEIKAYLDTAERRLLPDKADDPGCKRDIENLKRQLEYADPNRIGPSAAARTYLGMHMGTLVNTGCVTIR